MDAAPQVSPADQFRAARQAASAAAVVAARRANRLGLIRLLAFFGGLALVILAGVEVHPLAGVLVAALGLAGFNRLIGLQQGLDAERLRLERVVALNDGELASLAYDFGAFPTGEASAAPGHPYASDLDVFGTNSVFQLLARTATTPGTEALARFLAQPLTSVPDVEARQAAVRELAPLLAWRQAFLAEGAAAPTDAAALDTLHAWAAAPPTLTERWWPAAIWGLSLFNVAWLAAFLYLPFYLALLAYLPSFLLLRRFKPAVDATHASTSAAVELLGRYQAMLGLIEAQPWRSPLLQSLAAPLLGADSPASVALRALAYDARQLAIRVNPFVLALNLFSFWEVRYARRIERWKATYLSAQPTLSPQATKSAQPTSLAKPTPLTLWLTALATFDALTSLAAAHHRWPHWVFPRFRESGDAVDGTALHHPLLPPGRSVANDLHLPVHAHVKLLTGSNMAGKSTFLRTVGLHLVLAQAGCPVPAAALSLPLVRVYTSMRTQDDLHEGASAFYAELQRLRVVVDAIEETDGLPVVFLLDEILKGTNSDDRTDGARALIRQFLQHGGAGVIATHDLALGTLAATSDGHIENLRLEVETDAAGDLYFDYTVKPGLAQSRNASALMRRLGLGAAR